MECEETSDQLIGEGSHCCRAYVCWKKRGCVEIPRSPSERPLGRLRCAWKSEAFPFSQRSRLRPKSDPKAFIVGDPDGVVFQDSVGESVFGNSESYVVISPEEFFGICY